MSDQQRGAWEEWWAQDLHQQAAAAAAASAQAHHNQNSSNLFGPYKMAAAPNFQNQQTPVSTSGGYDYRMPTASNHAAAAAAVAASQWWYPPAANMQNMQNIPSPQQLVNRTRMPRVAKADAKPRGRMTAYAFFVQICREEHKKKHPEENVVFSEFSKKCAERWKTMSDKEKKRFHEMADKDKKRYDTEMQSYVPPKGEKQRGKKRKHIKDPNAPKRSLSAFFWFCNDERGKVKAVNPEYGVGDIAKELGRRWANADSQTKLKYDAMAEKDKARYEREMSEYKKKPKGPQPSAPAPPTKNENDGAEDDGEDEDEEEEDE